MLSLYLFSVLVGGILLAASAFGGHGHDHDGHIGDGHGHDSDGSARILSLRTLTYFLFVFGGVGGALAWRWSGLSSLIVFPIALLSGLSVAGLVAFTFRYLAMTDSGGRDSEDSFVGLAGRVVLPIGDGGFGKVMVTRGDRSYELLARPLDTAAAGIKTWKSVVVVEMARGMAIVAPLDDVSLESRENEGLLGELNA